MLRLAAGNDSMFLKDKLEAKDIEGHPEGCLGVTRSPLGTGLNTDVSYCHSETNVTSKSQHPKNKH